VSITLSSSHVDKLMQYCRLVGSTKSEEDVDVYLTKLAYSLGRGTYRLEAVIPKKKFF
jgi:hypothetical protein